MKRGYNQGTTKYNSTLADDIRFCHEAEYDAIEIRIDKLQEYLKDASVSELRRSLANAGLTVHALNAIKEINLGMEADRAGKLAEVKEASAWAQTLGCSVIVLVPSIHPEMRRRNWGETERRSVEAISAMAEVAEPYGVRLAIEPIGFGDCAIPTVQKAWSVVRQIPFRTVGLLLDTFNIYVDPHHDQFDFGQLSSNEVLGIHVADAEAKAVNTLTQENRLWPGHGVIPLCELIASFLRSGYRGPLSVELFRPEYYEMNPRETVAKSAQTLQQLIAECEGSGTWSL